MKFRERIAKEVFQVCTVEHRIRRPTETWLQENEGRREKLTIPETAEIMYLQLPFANRLVSEPCEWLVCFPSFLCILQNTCGISTGTPVVGLSRGFPDPCLRDSAHVCSNSVLPRKFE